MKPEFDSALETNSAEDNLKRLIDWFVGFESCIVAFSAGVDSSLLALAAKKALQNRAYAVTSHSPSFPRSEKITAELIAKEIGIKLIVVDQDDLGNSWYVKNEVTRCYFCRNNLASAIYPIAQRLSVKLCVDGTHLDDMRTPRPGIRALREAGFRAPLAELEMGKDAVRAMARYSGLSNWDRPSEACLSSRIAFGQEIDEKTLRRIESAEIIVRSITGARTVRVRTIGR
ncbi:MAG: ATP-dependent sacrificial sulfur transferase LarE, partial [Rhabdochlamydiaceae bacterium]